MCVCVCIINDYNVCVSENRWSLVISYILSTYEMQGKWVTDFQICETLRFFREVTWKGLGSFVIR